MWLINASISSTEPQIKPHPRHKPVQPLLPQSRGGRIYSQDRHPHRQPTLRSLHMSATRSRGGPVEALVVESKLGSAPLAPSEFCYLIPTYIPIDCDCVVSVGTIFAGIMDPVAHVFVFIAAVCAWRICGHLDPTHERPS